MVLDSTSTIKPDYDRKAELIAFDQTKMGVKEIIDGITQVPRVFHIPSPRTLKNSVEPSFSKPCLPTIDLEGIDEDSIRQKEVIKEVKDAPETWGFFRMMAQPVQNVNHLAFRSMFEREKLSENNFYDWFLQLKLVLRVEKKMYVIEQPLPAAPAADSEANVLAEWNALYDAYNEVACLMLGSMTPKLHRQFEIYSPYEVLQELKSMFEKQVGVETFDLIQTFHACKQEVGKPVATYVLQMKGYVDQLERLGYMLPQDLIVGLILNGLTKDFVGFVRNYDMHNMGKTIGELHAMLIEYEKGLPKKAETPQVMMIKGGKIQKSNKKSLKAKGKGKTNGKGKDKQVYIPKLKNPKPAAKENPTKDDTYHHCKEVGHWKRNYHVYLAELLKKKSKLALPVLQRFREARKLKQGSLYLYMGNSVRAQVETCAIYFITFTDDYSHYGYVYLLKHKHEVFETFKVFKNEVENQLKQTTKALQSDRGGEYISYEFKDYLKACGIVQQLTPPYTPQQNSVSERRNQSATRIFNMVPTKKVNKTLYELWYEKVPNLSYLKVWGCEALVKRDTRDKLQQRSVKCIFIGYPKETIGCYFYFPPENKIVVTRYAEFFEKNLITQEVSGRAIDLEEIQDEDTSPSEITNEIPMEVEGFELPQEEVISIRMSERTHRAPNHLCPNVEVEEHSLGDLNEPASYKAAMLNLESNKWVDAMNAKIQSMIENMVWVLVDLPPNCKTVESKWVFKKKTDMDGIVHTYKARLVKKGYTQLYGVDYEETFSPVADIRAIRILISIAAYYDYEIWKIDVKTAFLNGYLDEDIYMASESNVTFLIMYVDDIIIMGNHIPSLQSVKDYHGKCFAMKYLGEAAFILEIKIYRDRSKRLIGLGQNDYMDKILKRYKIDNSKRGHIPMQE
nr:hypothetical protein [Tanacetum cinerariifolium]